MIYLRKLKITDSEVSWKWRNNPEVWKLTGRKWNNYVSQEIEKDWIKKVISESNSVRLAICLSENDEYIGNVQFTNITESFATFHIFIGEPKYWGRGIGLIATQQSIDYARNNLTINTIKLSVKKDNIAAIKIYKKVGFKIYGSEIDDFLMQIKI